MALYLKGTNNCYPFIHFSFVKSQKLFHVLTHGLGKDTLFCIFANLFSA